MSLVTLTSYPAAWALLLLPFLYIIATWALAGRRPKNYPPGPPPVLGLGNILQIPPEHAFLKFHEWKQTFGDIIGLKVGSQNMVVLQSAEHVKELIEKRGSIYSDRPQPYITAKLINPGTIISLNNDHTIKRARTAMRYMFSPAEVPRVLALQTALGAMLLREILDDPGGFRTHMKRWALATPLAIVSGQEVGETGPSSTEAYFGTQKRWLRFLTPTTAPPVEIFPALKHLPGFLARWRREALELKGDMFRMMYHMLDGAQAQHASSAKGLRGGKHESVMSRLIRDGETAEDLRFGDHELALFGSGTLDAAVDTIIATTSSVMLVFGAFPEVQKRVQAEVDAIWLDDVPTPEKLGQAKFLRAVLTETTRWRPAAPTAVPRVLSRDDTYRDYSFSKGTMFIINAWSIHMDEEWYDRPEEFRPERYLDNKWGVRPGKKAAAEKQNRHATYGFGVGRRMCPGLDYAENQVMITMAKMAWEFDVVAKGELECGIEKAFHSDLVLAPKAFDVGFVPRSEGRKNKLVEDDEEARKVFATWVQ
ncbi:Cytochrome P450 monooxygenase patH [Colletotrichum sidae]|uniref:Cytochrome P450 monooxygenase patH n=1 Tax=Colletotrichum sidae TaxID=1347389 RepID=A0A4R8TNP5_9PEZI|nr:Cytochrome P450 monooxygenase patH [Colletotrichum sidae]